MVIESQSVGQLSANLLLLFLTLYIVNANII